MSTQTPQPHGQSTTVIRAALTLEALANLFGAACMLAYPSQILTWALPAASSSPPSALANTLLQWLAALVLGLTPQLLLAAPDTPRARGYRKVVYVTLGAGEAALVGVMAWHGATRTAQEVGVSGKALAVCGGSLALIAGWRAWAVTQRPAWFAVAERDEAEGRKGR